MDSFIWLAVLILLFGTVGERTFKWWPKPNTPVKSALFRRTLLIAGMVVAVVLVFLSGTSEFLRRDTHPVVAVLFAAIIVLPILALVTFTAWWPFHCNCMNPSCGKRSSTRDWRCNCGTVNRRSFILFPCRNCGERPDSYICPYCSRTSKTVVSLFNSGAKRFTIRLLRAAPEFHNFHETHIFRDEAIRSKEHRYAMNELQMRLEEQARMRAKARKAGQRLSRDDRYRRFEQAQVGLDMFARQKRDEIMRKYGHNPALRDRLLQVLDAFVAQEMSADPD